MCEQLSPPARLQGALSCPPDAGTGRAGRLQRPQTRGFVRTSRRLPLAGPAPRRPLRRWDWFPAGHPPPAASLRAPAQLHLQAQVPLRSSRPGWGSSGPSFPPPHAGSGRRVHSISGPGGLRGPARGSGQHAAHRECRPQAPAEPGATAQTPFPLWTPGLGERGAEGAGAWRQGLHAQSQPLRTTVLPPPCPPPPQRENSTGEGLRHCGGRAGRPNCWTRTVLCFHLSLSLRRECVDVKRRKNVS